MKQDVVNKLKKETYIAKLKFIPQFIKCFQHLIVENIV